MHFRLFLREERDRSGTCIFEKFSQVTVKHMEVRSHCPKEEGCGGA